MQSLFVDANQASIWVPQMHSGLGCHPDELYMMCQVSNCAGKLPHQSPRLAQLFGLRFDVFGHHLRTSVVSVVSYPFLFSVAQYGSAEAKAACMFGRSWVPDLSSLSLC